MRPSFGIEREYDAFAADGVDERCRKAWLGPSAVKAAVPTITRYAPWSNKRLRALDGAHAAADADHGFRRQHLDQIVVRAAAHGGIEIDDLNLRESGERSQHFLGASPSSAFSRPCTSWTTLPSIRSMQGIIMRLPDRNARAVEIFFQIVDGVSSVVKNRRRPARRRPRLR